MEFLSNNTIPPPKNLYPCLATISIHPAGEKSRRLSASSFGSAGGGEEENTLTRIISGGRRKSSFGAAAAGEAEGRRKSLVPPGGGAVGGSAIADGGVPERGTWYWRVQAGVTDNALLLLPLTSPPNPVLTSPPQPLSHAMPAHSAKEHPKEAAAHGHDSHEGVVDKVKNLFRRGSANPDKSNLPASGAEGGDHVIDQTAAGEQLPSAQGHAAGATNVNANAEMGWPGVVQGGKLQAIVVPLNQVDKAKVSLGGGKKNEGSYVTVPVTSHFAAMTVGLNDLAGNGAKSGVLKLEFDKDWIGAKAEAEILHHQITSALNNDRAPVAESFQLGGATHSTANHGSHINPGAGAPPSAGGLGQPTGRVSSEYTPVESVSSGRKVAGEV